MWFIVKGQLINKVDLKKAKRITNIIKSFMNNSLKRTFLKTNMYIKIFFFEERVISNF